MLIHSMKCFQCLMILAITIDRTETEDHFERSIQDQKPEILTAKDANDQTNETSEMKKKLDLEESKLNETILVNILKQNKFKFDDLIPIVLDHLHRNLLREDHFIEFDYDVTNLRKPKFLAKGNIKQIISKSKGDHTWLNNSRPEYCGEEIFIVNDCNKLKYPQLRSSIKKWSYLDQLNECVLYLDPCNTHRLNNFYSLYDCITVCYRNKNLLIL